MLSPSPSLTGEPSSSTIYKARLIGDYILERLAKHKVKDEGGSPLMVAMHGPQGCGTSLPHCPGVTAIDSVNAVDDSGKTTVTDEIQRYLLFSKAKARCAILSLDGTW
jgi:pantothenate kinase-related protein Tda10